MTNNKKITIGLIITLFLVITGVMYYNGSISNTKDDKTVTTEFLKKSHQVTKKDITEFDVGSPVETSIERYEKMLREKYEIYFSEKGMILAIANRDTDWLVQAAVNNGFTATVKDVILTVREESTDKKVYDYELLSYIQFDDGSTKEIKRQGYIQLTKENEEWLIDRCRIDQNLKDIIK